jgi:hypothetical protein
VLEGEVVLIAAAGSLWALRQGEGVVLFGIHGGGDIHLCEVMWRGVSEWVLLRGRNKKE